jgi:outer membrane protein OmpA-like peptidoglycan-associated protein
MFARSTQRSAESLPEAEQSYLASAADLMIGLLFVFIIMVAFLALQKKAEEEARAGDRDPRGAVTVAIGEEIRKTLPSVKIDPASGVITLPEDLLFDLGSSVLKNSAVEQLGTTSRKLSEVLRCFVSNQKSKHPCPVNPYGHEIETIFIEGHTDSIPMNRPGGNITLSLDRAISVNASLVQGTVLADFKNKDGHPIFSYSAYAESRPLIKENPADGRNRRVDLRIVLTYKPPETMSTIGAVNAAVKH